ncbi:hypothetical protein Tco_0084529 [Tanacetum coccineum]
MEMATTIASSLEAEQDNGNINRTQSMATLNESFPQGTDSGSGPRCQDTILGAVEAQIRVNAGVSKLMLLSLNLLLPVLVYAARHSLTVVRHKLMLSGITSYCWAKTVNGERQIQALVEKKKVVITEKSVRSDLMLEDAEGTGCLPNDVIFEQLTLMGAKTTAWNEFSSTMASAIICLATNQKFNFSKYIFDNMIKNLEGGVKFIMYLRFVQVFLDKQVEGMSKHKGIYVTPSHTKKIFANMKREGKGFSGRITPLFQTMMVQAPKDMGEDSAAPTDSKESNGFKGIIDFLNASSIKYALTVNPTVYESCIKQFWATAKAKTVNGERQIQALVDKKKVIITEKSVRSDLMLEDAEGTECLPNDVIFEQLTLMGYENLTQKLTFYKAYFSSQWKFLIHTILQCLSAKTTAWNEFSSTMASAIICLATNQKFNFSKYIFDNMIKNLEGGVKFIMYLRFVQVFLDKQVEGMSKHKGIYVTPSHTKKIFANMKREGKGFSGRITPLFQTMMVQAPKDMGEDSAAPTDSHSTPIITQPSSSKPQKKKFKMKQRKDSGPTKPIPEEANNEEPISTPSCDPPQSGEDRLQLTKLMSLCTKLQKQVLDLEEAKTAQAKEIASLKKRVKQLEKRRKSRTSGLKRFRKVGSASMVESSNDVSLGAQEDASKQGRKITDLDADAEVTLIDETQERNDEDLVFHTNVLNGDEVFKEPITNAAKTTSSFLVSAADPVTTTGEVVTTASATTTINELTLAQTLIEIKAAKPKAVTTAATTITNVVASTRPKAKGIVFHDQEEQAPTFTPIVSSLQASQLPQAKDKGKAKIFDPKKPLKKKDQIAHDEELALRLHAEEQAELERKQKERVAQEEASREAII